ncbi:tRNA adenosine(34) deaminase TadA [Pseudobdellovibrio sp. HCB154]|uniref:tRNA adenosine(34) deaminase TadA n=1 Tax=Pseudobdellovibrio sp. HCB154 TaxID=3386277 RepID=UPI0039176584
MDQFTEHDHKFMQLAFKLAKNAQLKGEVPIGAVVVDAEGKVIGKSGNKREQLNTVLGHAELVALHRACKSKNSWRLIDCTLYVTLEPCYMCAGALVQSRIKRVVFATHDPKAGAMGSLEDLSKHAKLNHRFTAENGLMQHECSTLLKNFFKQKRSEKKST